MSKIFTDIQPGSGSQCNIFFIGKDIVWGPDIDFNPNYHLLEDKKCICPTSQLMTKGCTCGGL